MKRVIFTCYNDLDLDVFEKRESAETNKAISDYFDELVKNKKDYAEHIGADFKFYHNTMKDFKVETELEFTKVNLYKHFLMSELANQYDEVMYVDMDVIFNTDENVFEELDLNEGIHVKDQNHEIISKSANELLFSRMGLRNPTLKYHITKDLLDGRDNDVINTGIVIGKSKHIKLLKFKQRIHLAINKIKEIKKEALDGNFTSFLQMDYYPNNESIFSYILRKYNIPYVIMEDKWHKIVDHNPIENIDAKIYHFINKRFDVFFRKKTYCVFSLYIKIEDENLDNPKDYTGDPLAKSKRTQVQLEKYKDQLNQNKIEYAKNINADYFLFERDDEYVHFLKRFPDLSEYDVVNLYKIYKLDQLSKKYDYVLYLDFDVYCRRNVNFFDFIGTDSSVGCLRQDKETLGIPDFEDEEINEYFKTYNHDFRSPHSKYWNAHALLINEGLDGDNKVFNTGIVGVSKSSMEKLDYFSDIDEVIAQMKELKEFSIYHENVSKEFGYDNETIFSYKVNKNNLSSPNLDHTWHFKHTHNHDYRTLDPTSHQYKIEKRRFDYSMKEKDPVFVHFISKNFALVFETVDIRS